MGTEVNYMIVRVGKYLFNKLRKSQNIKNRNDCWERLIGHLQKKKVDWPLSLLLLIFFYLKKSRTSLC